MNRPSERSRASVSTGAIRIMPFVWKWERMILRDPRWHSLTTEEEEEGSLEGRRGSTLTAEGVISWEITDKFF